MENLTNFKKSLQSYGHFNVTYTSPKTGKSWTTLTTDTRLIDRTFGSDNPTQTDLNRLKKTLQTINQCILLIHEYTSD